MPQARIKLIQHNSVKFYFINDKELTYNECRITGIKGTQKRSQI